ncbi:outer membrane protein assembly factor BamD [candidate division WOR-3 bacterium]|nr:outer membrane protein assembly factor BamD [candidate division WOR-3 bacterium]
MNKTLLLLFSIALALGCSPKRLNLESYTDESVALTLAQELFDKGDYSGAAEAFNYLYLSFDFTRYKSYALFMSGLSYFNDRKYDDAIETFKVFYNKYPSDSLLSSAVFYWAQSYEKSSPSFERDLLKIRYALETYRLFLARFPSDMRSAEIFERIRYCENTLMRKLIYQAQVYRKMNRHESAYIVLSAASTVYPNSDYVSQAEYEAALSALKIGDYDAARAHLQKAAQYETEFSQKAREKLMEMPGLQNFPETNDSTLEE